MLSRFYLNIRVLLKHVMSFFDTLSDGDRAEIGYGIGGDPTAFGVLMHQHREAQALQRQIAQHGTGYQAASMAGTLAQATEPSTASPAVAGEALPRMARYPQTKPKRRRLLSDSKLLPWQIPDTTWQWHISIKS